MSSKILTALITFAALCAFPSASARTPEQRLDDGGSQGGILVAARPSPFRVAVARRFPRTFEVKAAGSDVMFQAKAPTSLRVASTDMTLDANRGIPQLQASREVPWLQAQGESVLQARGGYAGLNAE